MSKFLYNLAFVSWYLLSLLPLRVLYVLSDGIYLLVFYVVRYRKPLVHRHLTECFPEKDSKEIRRIEKAFYHWFCDYIVETIKLLTIGKKEIRKRMRFENVELVERVAREKKSTALYLGHYCNWEWVTSLPLWLSDNVTCAQIYHVLENPEFDRLFLRLRGRMGAESIPMAETLRRMVRMRAEGKNIIIGFIADQVPFWNNIHYWTDFLHHDTPVLTGTERLARGAKMVGMYLDIRREKRGYYVATFRMLAEDPNALTDEFGLTELYFRALEKSIQAHPQYWLWTHNRWKRTRAEWERIIDPVTKKMRVE